jgi:DNA-binding transcriptional ArsR family regulator
MVWLSQRALTASDADAALFVDRERELERVERALRLGFNVFILAPAGGGVTSLLRQLERRLGEEVAYVNAGSLAAFDGLLSAISRALGSRILVDTSGDPLAGLRSAATERGPATVLLDGAERALRHELFGRQRDELWELPLQWVANGASPPAPPADSFFETTVRLEPLDEPAMQEVLRRRAVADTDDADPARLRALVDRVPALLGEAWPRDLLAVARELMLAEDPDAGLEGLAAQRAARDELSETAVRVLDALAGIGPVHAGDERLLEEIGTTRARVNQVLKELEAAGLVVAEQSGRRRLYAPARGSVQHRRASGQGVSA